MRIHFYADDITIYIKVDDKNGVINSLDDKSETLFNWFHNDFLNHIIPGGNKRS